MTAPTRAKPARTATRGGAESERGRSGSTGLLRRFGIVFERRRADSAGDRRSAATDRRRTGAAGESRHSASAGDRRRGDSGA
ncbi:MAG: hypothetical protein ACRDSK_06460, partial [Actinophytocola sp.]|uniref:hypothetical protein n=1 Tax=Actinophytocola sp. TaxID=1872138 RepID=UPI003D6B7968